jgi:hypothetical protein
MGQCCIDGFYVTANNEVLDFESGCGFSWELKNICFSICSFEKVQNYNAGFSMAMDFFCISSHRRNCTSQVK